MDDLSLVLDRRTELGTTPGLHAIIIGVSEYEFLPAVDDPPGEGLQGLQKLESSALSGWTFAEKLKALDAEKRLIRPLKTLRLLLAPSAREIMSQPALTIPPGLPPLSDNIRIALSRWRRDIATSQAEQALFHFSGHGIRRSLEETILLASDFLNPDFEAKLFKAFSLRSIYNGMVPSAKFPDIGREQFYFVDACRDKPEALDELEDTDTPKIFEGVLGGFDDRKAPIFFATKTGGSAAGLPGQVTYFTSALLWALDNGAFEAQEYPDVDGKVWLVTAQTLKAGIEAANLLFENRIELTGLVSDPALCFRRDRPSLTLRMNLKPQTALGNVSKLALEDHLTKTESVFDAPEADKPWACEIQAGNHFVIVEGKPGSFAPVKSDIQYFSIQTRMPWGFTIAGAV